MRPFAMELTTLLVRRGGYEQVYGAYERWLCQQAGE